MSPAPHVERRLQVAIDDDDPRFLVLKDTVTCKYYPDNSPGKHVYAIPAIVRKEAIAGDHFFDELSIEVDGVDITETISESDQESVERDRDRLLPFKRSLALPKLKSGQN
ncbi:MAG: hypothetical protein AAF098_10850 [Pseudomonadota bacterium]